MVTGSNMDGSRTDKGDVIREALTRLGQPNKREVVMVGDRKHDVEGARREDIDAIGVTWGYAPEGELEAAEPTFLASSLSDLHDLLLDSNGHSTNQGEALARSEKMFLSDGIVHRFVSNEDELRYENYLRINNENLSTEGAATHI